MRYRTRTYYTDAQKALMWERWKQGWTLHQIGQLFDRAHTSVRGVLAQNGGFRPPRRSRSAVALTLAEREEISRAMAEGLSIRSIAAQLGRAPSTVSRELRRNGGRAAYRASDADQAGWERALRPKCCKLVNDRALAKIVTHRLRLLWSPEQIAGWLKTVHPHDESCRVSHETIYRSLFIQARGALKKELLEHLRRTRGMRRSRHHTQKTDIHGQIVDAVSISERPASVEDRAVPGHWEGDLLFGSSNSQIATLVERQTRYLMLVRVAAKDTQTVVDAQIKTTRKLPQEAVQVADLGSRQGDGRSQAVHARHRHQSLLSAIHAARGSAAATRTRMACSGSTCPRASTSRATHRPSSTPWRDN
jgi:IS30 family transposase